MIIKLNDNKYIIIRFGRPFLYKNQQKSIIYNHTKYIHTKHSSAHCTHTITGIRNGSMT